MKKISRSKQRKTRDAVKILDRMIGDDRELRKLAAECEANAHVAQIIYDARAAAGLTQAELARLIGTKQPVIARLEDADYRGHSLTMLQRIAAVLHRHLEIRFAPTMAGRGTRSGRPVKTGT